MLLPTLVQDLPTIALSPASNVPEVLHRYLRCARSENTWRTYQSQWRRFAGWCQERGMAALPAEPMRVGEYLATRAQSGASVASLDVALAAVRFVHAASGLPLRLDDATLAMVMKGIRREHLRAQRQAEPLTGGLLRCVLSQPTLGVEDLRDGALLALLYIFGLRASEVAALDWQEEGRGRGWLRLLGDRAEIVLLGSKAAPSRAETIIIPAADNPLGLGAIARWVAYVGITAGEPVLRAVRRGGGIGANRLHAGNVGGIVKRAMARHFKRMGMPADVAAARAEHFSGHSGRVGMYVTATEAGVAPQHLAALARHASLAMVRRYAARADMLRCAPHKARDVGV